MKGTEAVPGYAYDSSGLERSPVSPDELEDLRGAIGFGPADERALRVLWEAVDGHAEELFELWMSRVAGFFLPTFSGPDGRPDQRYLDAAHPRFMRWIEDTCTRPYDQAWLDYQHEIALRHHRTRKNRTDRVESAEIVPFRYLPLALHLMTATVRPFLARIGVEASEAERLAEAWAKSLTLQVTLWSVPYVRAGDW